MDTKFQPAFSLNYPGAYLIISWGVVAFILSAYTRLMNGLIPEDHLYREYLICGGQILFQGLIVSQFKVSSQQKWIYLSHMMTISLGGAVLLLPVLAFSHWVTLPPFIYAIYFIGVAGLMFLEHIRRTRILKLGWTLSLTWALYRMLILAIILF